MTDNPNNTSLPDTGVASEGSLWWAIYDALDLSEELRLECAHAVFDALSARASVAVAAKALSWEEYPGDGEVMHEGLSKRRRYLARAVHQFGAYCLMEKDGRYSVKSDYTDDTEYPTDIAAKAAAQSDFEARIRASLTAPVEETVEPFWGSPEHERNRMLETVDALRATLKEARQFMLAPAEDLLWGVVHRIDAALASAASPSIAGERPEPWELEAAAIFMDHVEDDETGSVHRVAAFLRAVAAQVQP